MSFCAAKQLQFMHHPSICSLCVILACELTNCIQQLVHWPPQSFPQNSEGVRLHLGHTTKLTEKNHIPRKFLATDCCFKRNTYHVTVLSWLKKEQEE